MADINPTIPIIAINVNGLNKPTETVRVNPKTRATICCLQATHLKYKDTDRLKGIGKMYNANTNQKKAERNILISGKAKFRRRKVIRIKRSIT